MLIDGETIAAIGNGLDATGAEVLDAAGCVVLPGLVDNHTHMAMPTSGTVTCDDFDSGTRAALAGGTTTIVDFALQTDGGLLRGLETWHEKAAGRAHCDYGFHLAISDANPRAVAEMGRAVEEGVSTFKAFMAFKGAFMVDDEQLLRVLRQTGESGGMLLVHAENGDAIELYVQEALAAEEHGAPLPRQHAPPEAEAEATGRADPAGVVGESGRCSSSTSPAGRSRGGSGGARRAASRSSPRPASSYVTLTGARWRGAELRRRAVRLLAAAADRARPGGPLPRAAPGRAGDRLDRPLPLHAGAEGDRPRRLLQDADRPADDRAPPDAAARPRDPRRSHDAGRSWSR